MRWEAILIIIIGVLITIIGLIGGTVLTQDGNLDQALIFGILAMIGITMIMYVGLGYEKLEKYFIGYYVEDKENEIIDLARKFNGTLTLNEVMNFVGLDLRNSEKLLERLKRKNICLTDIEDYKSTGIITYFFPKFNPDFVKKFQDQIPDSDRPFITNKQESVSMKKRPDYQKIAIILTLIFGITTVIYYILSFLFK